MRSSARRVLDGLLAVTCATLAGSPGTAAAATTRVSISSSGEQADGRSHCPALSGDGRYVAFRSEAANLVPGDTNGVADAFVHDRQSGTTARVSVASGGSQANQASGCPALSADGRFVAFVSAADDLVPADTNAAADVFVHDRLAGTTLRITAGDGSQPNGPSYGRPALSGDGRFLLFATAATNLTATAGEPGRYVLRDLLTGATTRLDTRNGISGSVPWPSLSHDGAVALYSDGLDLWRTVATGATTLLAQAGIFGRVVHPVMSADGGTVAWVQSLSRFGQTESSRGFWEQPARWTYGPRGGEVHGLSADGRLAVVSGPSLRPADHGCGGLLFDRASGTGLCATLTSDGWPARVPGFSMSDDASAVALETDSGGLVPGDTNGVYDVFVVDAPTTSVSVGDASIDEGAQGSVALTFRVTLSTPVARALSVDYATQDVAAKAGEDYTAAVGTLVFGPGETEQTLAVAVSGDTVVEETESFVVRLGSSEAVVQRGYGQGIIRDDDGSWARPQPAWHGFFSVSAAETPLVGDFDGDGRKDIATFTRDNPLAVGDAYVALSEGFRFGPGTKWHDWMGVRRDESLVVGDFDGDGRDDVAAWLRASSGAVYVALSDRSRFGEPRVWLQQLGSDPTDLVAAGDVDGDGRDDLVLFARREGRVYVASSHHSIFTGAPPEFGAPQLAHGFFAVSIYERPRVADLDGDDRDDILTFATDSPTALGDVYAARSDGTRFVDFAGNPDNSTKLHDWFAVQPSEEVRVGDLDGDGRMDLFTFLPQPWGQCYTVRSLGAGLGENVLWREKVTARATDVPFAGDVDGDGRADVITFAQAEGRVHVSLAP